MSEHMHNDTLEEQRRARQEFLELKKMQQGEMDTGPKPSEIAIVPKTPSEKLKNIWFHDKWLIIGGILLAVVLAVLITQCATRTEYDLEIVAYTYTPMNDTQLGVAAEYMAQFCDDISGDGEVHIQIINCSFSNQGGDVTYRNTMATKLQAVLAADANALLFITDKDSIKYFDNISGDVSLFEDEPLKLNEKFYEKCGGEGYEALPEGLQISCRKVSGTTIQKNKKVEDYYEQSQKILAGLRDAK